MKYKVVCLVNDALCKHEELWSGYLEDIAVQHFKAMEGTTGKPSHHKYIIRLWEDLLTKRAKEHRLVSLHVLIHLRHRQLQRVIEQLQPLNFMEKYLSGEAPATSEMAGKDLMDNLHARVGERNVETNLRFPGESSTYGRNAASTAKLDEVFYCKVIMEQLNNALRCQCTDPQSEDTDVIRDWMKAISGIVSVLFVHMRIETGMCSSNMSHLD